MSKLVAFGVPEGSEALTDIRQIVDVIQSDNEKGFEKCKSVLVQQQIAAGTYQCNEQPQEPSMLVSRWVKLPFFSYEVAPEVPAWLLLPLTLVEIILDNCIHNATTHGASYGPLHLAISICIATGRVILTLVNLPGPQHAKALKLQEQCGINFLFRDWKKDNVDVGHIGSAQSTFLGMNEMLEAAKLMNADIGLVFEETCVVFTLALECKPCSPPPKETETELALPDGTFLICADDDAAPRMGYKGLANKLGMVGNMKVLGETYTSAMSIVDTVLQKAQEQAQDEHRLIVILDQNMDYDEGKVSGTKLVAQLRQAGFIGLAYIRSANDSPADVNEYLHAGADGCLSKRGNVRQLATDLVKKSALARQARE